MLLKVQTQHCIAILCKDTIFWNIFVHHHNRHVFPFWDKVTTDMQNVWGTKSVYHLAEYCVPYEIWRIYSLKAIAISSCFIFFVRKSAIQLCPCITTDIWPPFVTASYMYGKVEVFCTTCISSHTCIRQSLLFLKK